MAKKSGQPAALQPMATTDTPDLTAHLQITVYTVGTLYLALIAHGWCAAYGPTLDSALARVKHRYHHERDYFRRVSN